MTLDEFVKIMNSGSNVALLLIVWLAYKSVMTAHDAVKTLKALELNVRLIRKENTRHYRSLKRALVVNTMRISTEISELPELISPLLKKNDR